MLTDQQIKDFQNLYREHYHENISRERALEEGMKLLRFIALINNIKNK